MTSYRIVCTTQDPPGESHHHAHIVAVGIDDDGDGIADQKMPLGEVLRKLDDDDSFYTIGEHSKKKVFVHDTYCCGKRYIKTDPDDYLDNNLDEIRKCNWKR